MHNDSNHSWQVLGSGNSETFVGMLAAQRDAYFVSKEDLEKALLDVADYNDKMVDYCRIFVSKAIEACDARGIVGNEQLNAILVTEISPLLREAHKIRRYRT